MLLCAAPISFDKQLWRPTLTPKVLGPYQELGPITPRFESAVQLAQDGYKAVGLVIGKYLATTRE